jgi:hypothetical protein
LRTKILDVPQRIETLSPSNSYTFGLDSTTSIEKRIFMEFDSIEDIMDMRDIFLLMASHQPIKVNNSHE